MSDATTNSSGVLKRTDATIILPTLREALNLPALLHRIERVRDESELDLRVLIIDDDSQDGTEEAVRAFGRVWVRLVIRRPPEPRGLAAAVIHGFAMVETPRVVVMDADLSHPPECVAELLGALDAGGEMAVGSRYCEGGSTDAEWTVGRRITSRVATWMALPFTNITDPMSGMIAFDRGLLERAGELRPLGYKIALELIVRGRIKRITEVPIHFTERRLGQSKLSARVCMQYFRHCLRLLVFKMFGGEAAKSVSGCRGR
jgi:dolichol-phosphate mannosyltransferase